VDYIGRTFANLRQDQVIQVPTVPPGDLPACDVLKIDVEGGEASILESMDVSTVSLILLEYQDMANRRRIEQKLSGDFACEFEDAFAWREILRGTEYRPELADDYYGHLFFVNRRSSKLRKTSDARPNARSHWPVAPGSLSLRQVLAVLPAAMRRAVSSRLP
jgi:hypothetical protein